MSAAEKRREKLQARMGAMREQYGTCCWVCGNTVGVKATSIRCARCAAENRHSDVTHQYDSLKNQFDKVKDRA